MSVSVRQPFSAFSVSAHAERKMQARGLTLADIQQAIDSGRLIPHGAGTKVAGENGIVVLLDSKWVVMTAFHVAGQGDALSKDAMDWTKRMAKRKTLSQRTGQSARCAYEP